MNVLWFARLVATPLTIAHGVGNSSSPTAVCIFSCNFSITLANISYNIRYSNIFNATISCTNILFFIVWDGSQPPPSRSE